MRTNNSRVSGHRPGNALLAKWGLVTSPEHKEDIMKTISIKLNKGAVGQDIDNLYNIKDSGDWNVIEITNRDHNFTEQDTQFRLIEKDGSYMLLSRSEHGKLWHGEKISKSQYDGFDGDADKMAKWMIEKF